MRDHVFAFGDSVAVPKTGQWSLQDEFLGIDSMKSKVGIQVGNIVQLLRPFYNINLQDRKIAIWCSISVFIKTI
jgi:hypothetical protein